VNVHDSSGCYRRIWYRSEPKLRRFRPLRAWEDTGCLTVESGRISFHGKRGDLVLDDPRVVSVGPAGVDAVNVWITVEDSKGLRALFADGSRFGWAGLRGGTKALERALRDAS
jgi:hypothetical protein